MSKSNIIFYILAFYALFGLLYIAILQTMVDVNGTCNNDYDYCYYNIETSTYVIRSPTEVLNPFNDNVDDYKEINSYFDKIIVNIQNAPEWLNLIFGLTFAFLIFLIIIVLLHGD
jgi:hypothetical protein